jgi:D-glycero-alpha-D-manno-heptose 1-phosphate guanylyltransferase
MQLVILAGGLGTRLRGVIPPGLPKPMATVAGRPFLEHVLDYATAQGVKNIHLLVGYAAEVICRHFGNDYAGASITYSYEDTPLGTGGALKAAEPELAEEFIYLNGDTLAYVAYPELLHLLGPSPLSMSLAKVEHIGRYGSVISDENVIVGFREKSGVGAGMINAGVYACRRDLLSLLPDQASFSFEADFLQPQLPQLRPRFLTVDSGFIDIGTPESYAWLNTVGVVPPSPELDTTTALNARRIRNRNL